ncbi:MAG: SHOCT domain-containing protein [candidate division WOR-3 bacterium]|nr:SHOCT domain-containing protein [candidate division WOR-3 bacterium]
MIEEGASAIADLVINRFEQNTARLDFGFLFYAIILIFVIIASYYFIQGYSTTRENTDVKRYTERNTIHHSKRDIINQIQELAKLHEEGILTDEEFEKEKTKLLDKL